MSPSKERANYNSDMKNKHQFGNHGLILLHSVGAHLKWGYDGQLVAERTNNQVCSLWPQGAEQSLPATCVFLAFVFPFQAFPLSTADEGWHGGISVLGFCKQINNIVVTCLDIWQCKVQQRKEAKLRIAWLQNVAHFSVVLLEFSSNVKVQAYSESQHANALFYLFIFLTVFSPLSLDNDVILNWNRPH